MGRTEYLIGTAVVVGLVGCVGGMPMPQGPLGATASAPPAGVRAYQPIDFKKWTSGMYADQFLGKAVVVDGYFRKAPTAGAVMSDIFFVVGKYSIPQMQDLERRSPGAIIHAVHEQIPISAPLSMRDTVFALSNDQRIRVYGVVVNPFSTSVFTKQVVMSTLRVNADRIEVVR